jgi:putative transferase (TIGR04331 family)
MTKVARHLITTADERTWKFDRPVLFLGEWCRLYDRRALWEGMDAIVAAPFGLEAGKKSNDIDYVQALSAKLLIELTEVLNAFHRTNHTPRYWNILLGHWLQRYVIVSVNRYFTIEKALKSYKIVSTTVFDSADCSLATSDSLSFISASADDVWNNMFYKRALQHIGCKEVESNSIDVKNEGSFKQKKSVVTTYRLSIKQFIKAISYYILSRLSKRNDSFIINSYLPRWQQVKLQLALWQCPQLWKSPPLNTVSIDVAMRRKFTLSSGRYTGFEQFVRDLLPDIIPACYLEGYAELNQQVESLPWPSKPKFIFTSNNFDTDEIFKAWAGLKSEQGVPYFTGQHGNNYGTMLGSQNWAEQVLADKFFTWGWTNGNIKNIPAFVFNIANKLRETKPDGGLLLIEITSPCPRGLHDGYYEFGSYQEQQFRFVEALPRKIQNELTVRLHSAWRNMRWSEDKRWSDRMPSVHLEEGDTPIQTLIAKNRLVVHSYDSTGILEGLASNIPTLCFWSGGLDHLLPSAKPYYELLRGAGILADSPEQAAQLVAQYWDDTDSWWKSEQVQSARGRFCEQYARIEKHPVRTMKGLLTTAAISKNNQTRNNA